ncbi:unnamed protein product [Rhizoctonia solani]|uniref:Metallo-beta-lactamase domain-containing protein n=1 Tax=Rhizoctonia solani TaxID=456999 RepID=A0A8H3H2H1_9AGAM|nr:unnamed protein product [Rhizoctonia solani]
MCTWLCEVYEPLDVITSHMSDLRVTFLGTSSGGGPTEGRNCSSLALSIRNETWLVDCAEGTQRQLHKSRHLNIHNVTKVFITHMHVDHCVGVVPLLSTVMSIFSPRAQSCNQDPDKLHVEIYGTPGLRQLIRSTLNLTHMNLSGKYIVHEFHLSEGSTIDQGPPHPNEIVGVNIQADSQQFWQNIGGDVGIKIDAGTIEHRVTCVGYVFTEKLTVATIPRRLVCLGDTSSASHIAPLCISEGIYPSLVVHESTNAWIPPHVDRHHLYGGARKTPQSVREKAISKGLYGGARKTPQSVREKAISKGHSTPDMAGAFARAVRAERLALIHFSAMFENPSPSNPIMREIARQATVAFENPSPSNPIMREIARQATVAWGRRGVDAIAAHDLYWMDIPPRPIESPESQVVQSNPNPSTVWDAHLWDDPLGPDQPMTPNLKRKWDKTHPTGARGLRGNWNRRGGRGRWRGRGGGGGDAHGHGGVNVDGRGDGHSSQT